MVVLCTLAICGWVLVLVFGALRSKDSVIKVSGSGICLCFIFYLVTMVVDPNQPFLAQFLAVIGGGLGLFLFALGVFITIGSVWNFLTRKGKKLPP